MIFFSRFKISGHSMEPVLSSGQTVLASNIFYFFSKPKVGDIIVFKNKNKIFIKRVARIDKNKFFVVGDNSWASTDSRSFGWIEKRQIVGKVFIKN